MTTILCQTYFRKPEQFVFFYGGFDGLTATDTVDKFEINSESVSPGTNLTQPWFRAAAISNGEFGWIVKGTIDQITYSTYADRHIFASDSYIPAANFGGDQHSMCGGSNTTTGIIGSGRLYGTGTIKYTWSTETIVSGTALSLGRRASSAAGNTTFAIFGGGFTSGAVASAYIDKYEYSTDNVIPGGAVLSVARGNLSACGNSDLALFTGGGPWSGYTNYTDIYDYSTNIVTPGAVLTVDRAWHASASNSTVGIIGGGAGGTSIFETNKYKYSNNTNVISTELSIYRQETMATSDSHGGI